MELHKEFSALRSWPALILITFSSLYYCSLKNKAKQNKTKPQTNPECHDPFYCVPMNSCICATELHHSRTKKWLAKSGSIWDRLWWQWELQENIVNTTEFYFVFFSFLLRCIIIEMKRWTGENFQLCQNASIWKVNQGNQVITVLVH